MRLSAPFCLCLLLTGCSAYAPQNGTATTSAGQTANQPSPGPGVSNSAATVYTVNGNVTGAAPCGTSSMSQVIGYPATASGPSSPTLTITSPNTVDRYSSPATDAAGNIYLHSAEFTQECSEVAGSEKILVFAPAASGTLTANPIRTISGPSANLYGAGLMAVDGPGNIYLWQSDYTRTKPATIVEFAAGADGNVAPIRTIEVAQYPSGNGAGFPAGLGVDGEGNIIFAVANLPTTSGGISTESDTIAVFTPGQTGNATPARTISGPDSQLTQIAGLGVDGAGNIYVAMLTVGTGADPAILEFAGGSDNTASVAPINRISGTQTMLSRFVLNSLSVDGPGNIYALTYTFPDPTMGTEPYSMLRFGVGATGNVAPTAALLSVTGVGIATH
jgi:hypothetical protein